MSDPVASAVKARPALASRLIVAAIAIGGFTALGWADGTGLASARQRGACFEVRTIERRSHV